MTHLMVIVCVAFDHRANPVGVLDFKKCIAECSFVEAVMETSGTYDLIVHARVESLPEYNEQMERIAPQLAEYVERIETNFVAKKLERPEPSKCSLWLPCQEGRRRVDAGMIDKIIAEGDYMRVYVGNWNSLLHDTIRNLLRQLDRECFIQLHRSVIVRIDFIDRLLHRERCWIARLRDGSQQRVAKSHVADVLRMMGRDSATDGGNSAKSVPVLEKSATSNEMKLRLVQ